MNPVLFLLLDGTVSDTWHHLVVTQEGDKLPPHPHFTTYFRDLQKKKKAIGQTDWRADKMSQWVRVLVGKD